MLHGLSFLKVIFTNGGSFDLLLLGTSLSYLKIAKFLNGSEKSMDPFKPQTKTIQVKPQTFRKACPGKTVLPTPLNVSAATGQSSDGKKRNGGRF